MDGAQDVVPKHHVLIRPGTIHVTVGEPIDTTSWKSETLEAHMRQAWLAVNECLRESRRRRDLAMGKATSDVRSDVVITTGGTGLTPTDLTPEVTRALLDREVPGIAEAIRAHGIAQGVPTAALSRGLAGVVGQALVVNLPGSRGGVKDGLTVVVPVLRHAVEQIVGSDH